MMRCEVLVEIGPVVLEKIIKKPNPISLFPNYIPFDEELVIHLNKP